MNGVRETEQRNGEKNKKTTQKNRRVSNFTPLTDEKEEKSLQSKKLNYFVTECASHQIHIPLLRERER